MVSVEKSLGPLGLYEGTVRACSDRDGTTAIRCAVDDPAESESEND